MAKRITTDAKLKSMESTITEYVDSKLDDLRKINRIHNWRNNRYRNCKSRRKEWY